VVVDRFSKLVKFGPTQTNAMVTRMTKLFFDMWVRHNGMPKVIVNDWDVKFTSEFWTLLMKKTRTKLKFNTIFHPEIDGQTEIMNGILNQYFRNYIGGDYKDWGDHLGLVKFCHNFTKHSVMKMSHFELALGVEVKQPMNLTIPKTRGTCCEGGKDAKNMGKEFEERKSRTIKLLEKAQASYEKQANKLQKHI
jgi:hypothetical protein